MGQKGKLIHGEDMTMLKEKKELKNSEPGEEKQGVRELSDEELEQVTGGMDMKFESQVEMEFGNKKKRRELGNNIPLYH